MRQTTWEGNGLFTRGTQFVRRPERQKIVHDRDLLFQGPGSLTQCRSTAFLGGPFHNFWPNTRKWTGCTELDRVHTPSVFNPAELQLGLGSLTEQGLFLSRAGPRTELDPNSSVRPGIVIFHVFGIVFL
jgi:hypothetical protein